MSEEFELTYEELEASNSYYIGLQKRTLPHLEFEDLYLEKYGFIPTDETINLAMAKFACTNAKLEDLI